MTIDFDQLKTWVFPIISAIIVWLFKDKALHVLNLKREEKSQEAISLENLQKKLDLYQEMLTDVPKQYKAQISDLEKSFSAALNRMNAEVGEMRSINQELEKLVTDQSAIISKQEKIITKQRRTIEVYETKYGPVDQN